MKRIVFNLCALALLLGSLGLVNPALAVDPSLNALNVSPDPIRQFETGTVVANFSVTGTPSIPIGDLVVQISFPNSYLPDPQAAAAVRATGAGSLFTWTYDAPNRTLNGTNNQVLASGAGGLITVDIRGYVVTDPNFDNVTANLVFPNGQPTGNSTGNDNLTAGGRITANPSPVSLISFNAAKEAQTAVLSWSTAEEINSDRFEVEHSLNGRNWRMIGSVAARGNSKNTQWYAFTDSNPANGSNLYRLRTVDRDGSFDITRAKSLEFDIAIETALYPNPVAERLLLKTDDLGRVRRVELYNASGKSVLESETVTASGIDVRGLPAGFYVVKVTRTNGSTDTFKVLKQ